MNDNVCVNCKYYLDCGKPERIVKCMGYKEAEEKGKQNEQKRDN